MASPSENSIDLKEQKDHFFVTEALEAGGPNAAISTKIDEADADATLKFLDEHAAEFEGHDLTPEEEKSLKIKNYFVLFSLILLINTMLFIDKATLSYSSILGIYKSTNIGDAQFDDLNSIFYTGYTLGQVLNFVLQKVNFAKFLTLTIFVWSILIFCHCGAYNFGGLIVLRLLLGFSESIITPALEITMLQFFTPNERATLQPIFWLSCVGSPVIIAGFVSYGVLHSHSSVPPWKLFMIITGGITFITALITAYYYPSDPSTAKFLTKRQRYFLIKRIHKETSSSVSQHVVKKHQIIECLKDPVSWLFVLFVFFLMLSNNLAYQQNLLYVSLGVSNLGSTLVSVAGGGFSSVWHIIAAVFIHFCPNNSVWVILYGCVPSIAGGIAMVTINWNDKLALLAMLVLAGNTFGVAYIVGLGWCTSTAGGNTKRYFRHFMWMVSYGIANIISPQLWKGSQGSKNGDPRYYAAWSVQIVLSWTGTPIVGFLIYYILNKRNKLRLENMKSKGVQFGTVIKHDEKTGEQVSEKVDIANLDLTDLENENFIYPL